MSVTLLRTPLFEEQMLLGGKMVPFAGWEMPVQFEGIIKEHAANRQGCSLFDCSHMGEFLIDGPASSFDHIVTQTIADMPLKTCRYGMVLNDKGGVIDDLIVYRMAVEKWMIVVNASNIDKDHEHFKRHLKPGAVFKDVSFETAKLDIQGPLSREILARLVPGIAKLEYYSFDTFDLLGERVIISRTGYTGELGFEIYYPWDKAKVVWDVLLADKRVRPTALGVRDVLRIEMCYPLYGHELTDEISPWEAGLKKFVDLSKDFIGKEALLEQEKAGISCKIVHFASLSRRSPRQGHFLFSEQGEKIGEVVSGTFSPALGRGIGIGFIKKTFTNSSKVIIFGDDKFKEGSEIVARPFYKEGSLKS
ncbi:MAG: glycine cleavage system aminomethyltransferase GcvT [Candidatus Omnitrophica bacterium]|nr:glycine cleavage system aminomethyltransferase GcvT [Candidatus Omnitrophota bacterium]